MPNNTEKSCARFLFFKVTPFIAVPERLFSHFCAVFRRLLVIFLLVCVGMTANISIAEAADTTTFRVDSAYGVTVGSPVIIDISVENPQDIQSCSFELWYDSDIVQVFRVEKGELVSTNDIFSYDLEDDVIAVDWVKNTGFMLSDGVLVRLSFIALAQGSTALSLQNLYLGGGGTYPYIVNGYISTLGSIGSLEIATSPFLPGANRNTWYSVSLTATGGTPPYSWSLISGSLPSGLTLSTSGVISGTTTSSKGNYSATIRVTDYAGITKSRAFTITVFEAGETPLSITSSSTLSRGRKGSSYSATLTAVGGSKPYSWSLVSGSLPPGLTLNSSGTISGTPTSTGSYTFTARVTDYNYARQEKQFTLTITDTGYLSDGEAFFRLLTVSRSTMRLDLTPENMPYTMVVDTDTDWVELTVFLYDTAEKLRINRAAASSGVVRTIPLHRGINQITIGVSPDGYHYRNYTLTVYRLP